MEIHNWKIEIILFVVLSLPRYVFIVILKDKKRVGCIVVKVLTSRVVNRGFEFRWGQTKD